VYKCTANPLILQYTVVDKLLGREIPKMNLGRLGSWLERKARRSTKFADGVGSRETATCCGKSKSLIDKKMFSSDKSQNKFVFPVASTHCQIVLEIICVSHGIWKANTKRSLLFCFAARRQAATKLCMICCLKHQDSNRT
jgi:hypothetical protein